jgi:hypothetical protein
MRPLLDRLQRSSSRRVVGLAAQPAVGREAGVVINRVTVSNDIDDGGAGNPVRVGQALQIGIRRHGPLAGCVQRQMGGLGRMVGIDRAGQGGRILQGERDRADGIGDQVPVQDPPVGGQKDGSAFSRLDFSADDLFSTKISQGYEGLVKTSWYFYDVVFHPEPGSTMQPSPSGCNWLFSAANLSNCFSMILNNLCPENPQVRRF